MPGVVRRRTTCTSIQFPNTGPASFYPHVPIILAFWGWWLQVRAFYEPEGLISISSLLQLSNVVPASAMLFLLVLRLLFTFPRMVFQFSNIPNIPPYIWIYISKKHSFVSQAEFPPVSLIFSVLGNPSSFILDVFHS